MMDQIINKKQISFIQIILVLFLLAWILLSIDDLKLILNPNYTEKDLVFKISYMIFFTTSMLSYTLVYMTLNQIKLNPFSSRVVTLLKWTSLLFFIIGATSTFIDTYRGLDGIFVIFGLTVNLISLIFYILSISLLIFGDILSEIIRIKDESDYIIYRSDIIFLKIRYLVHISYNFFINGGFIMNRNRNKNKYKSGKSSSLINLIYKYQRKFLVVMLQLLLFSIVLTTGLRFLVLIIGLTGVVDSHLDISPFIFEFIIMLLVSLVLLFLYKAYTTIEESSPLNIKNARYLLVLHRLFIILLICLLLYSIFINKHGNLLYVIEFRSLLFSLFILACLFYVFHKIFIGIIKMKEDYDLTI